MPPMVNEDDPKYIGNLTYTEKGLIEPGFRDTTPKEIDEDFQSSNLNPLFIQEEIVEPEFVQNEEDVQRHLDTNRAQRAVRAQAFRPKPEYSTGLINEIKVAAGKLVENVGQDTVWLPSVVAEIQSARGLTLAANIDKMVDSYESLPGFPGFYGLLDNKGRLLGLSKIKPPENRGQRMKDFRNQIQ